VVTSLDREVVRVFDNIISYLGSQKKIIIDYRYFINILVYYERKNPRNLNCALLMYCVVF